jgi:hypothetical protein
MNTYPSDEQIDTLVDSIGAMTVGADSISPPDTRASVGRRLVRQWLEDCIANRSLPAGTLEVALNSRETMVVVNHPHIEQDRRGGFIDFTPAEAYDFGRLVIRKAAQCKPAAKAPVEQASYHACLARIEYLIGLDPEVGSAASKELVFLATAVELYEKVKYPLAGEAVEELDSGLTTAPPAGS